MNGGDATTEFQAYKHEVKVRTGTIGASYWLPWHPDPSKRGSGADSVTGTLYPPPTLTYATGASVTAADNLALTKLYKDIRKNNTHFSGMTFLGELREALSMIRRPAMAFRRGLGEYLTTLNNRKRRLPKHRVREMAKQTWLEYSFGWTPLINDTIAAAETLARWNGIDIRRATAKGYGLSQQLEYAMTFQSSLGGYFATIQNVRQTGTCEVVYKVGLSYATSTELGSAERLLQLSGFSLEEFVPTVWELVPWSFVADYFSNVGDILMAATTSTSQVFRKTKSRVLKKTQVSDATIDYKSLVSAQPTLAGVSGDPGGYTSTRTEVLRTKVTTLGVPVLDFKFPPFDSCKWINLAALTREHRKLTPF